MVVRAVLNKVNEFGSQGIEKVSVNHQPPQCVCEGGFRGSEPH